MIGCSTFLPSLPYSTYSFQPLRKRVHDGCAHAMQPAGGAVRGIKVVLKLPARAELRENDLDGGNFLGRMNPHRNPAAVVDDRAASVGVDLDEDDVTEPRH